DDIKAQAVVDRQLRPDAPGVLPVIKMSPLALASVGVGADVTAKTGYITQQESRQAKSSTVHACASAIVEGQFTRAMGVARHPQIIGAADVGAELERVIADEFRCIADKLQLVLVLIERAVASVDAQTGTEIYVPSAVAVDESGEKSGTEVVEVESL